MRLETPDPAVPLQRDEIHAPVGIAGRHLKKGLGRAAPGEAETEKAEDPGEDVDVNGVSSE